MARESVNFPLVLVGGGLGLWLLLHAIWSILFEDWLKHELERLVGHTVAEMMEKFGAVGFPALAAIAIVWLLYSYIQTNLESELAHPAVIPPRPQTVIFDPSWVRDVPLLDALWRAHLGRWNARETYPLGDWEAVKPFYKVANNIRQKAFEGELPIWAR